MKKLKSLIFTIFFAFCLTSTLITATVYAEGLVAMSVNGTEYTEHGKGWSEAVKLASDGTKTNIILYADWNAVNGNFSYSAGTDNGCLYINDSDVDLSIELNGHTINRGLASAVSDGQVFKISGGKITITDRVGTGKITGGNNTGNGGAFCVENKATLTLNGGKIYRNNAQNGGGVYVCNASFFMNGGSVEKNTAEYGGGISLDKEFDTDTESIVCKGGIIAENSARLGGGIFLDSSREDVIVTFENTQISDNFATEVGGGVYIGFTYEVSEVTFGEGTSITRNMSDEGGGVYIDCGSIRLIGVHITENRAFTRCGGVGVDDDLDDNAHGTIREYGTYTLGGDLYIQNNYVLEEWSNNAKINSNLRIGDITCDLCYDVNNPFTSNASIGIDMYADFGTDEIEEKLSDLNGNFSIDSFEHFTSDNSDYIITALDLGASAGENRYQIYSEQAHDALDGGINGAILKSNFKSDIVPVIDKQNKTVTLSINPKMGRTLENVALFTIADFTFGNDVIGISEGYVLKDLSAETYYRWQVMVKDDHYELWYIKIIPCGGTWSEEDGCAARVTFDGKTGYYADFETAWTKAVEASTQNSTILVLNKDWHAGDTDSNGTIDSNETTGAFEYYKDGSEYGTNNGSLYLDELTMNLTIDLNGHTIDRGLTSAVSDGYVLYMDIYGSVTITDSSEAQTGTITGGNNTDDGGAFYVDYGTLYINGGNITGNKAEYGGAIYINDLDDAYVYITDGKIYDNTATEDGGAIYANNGYLYFDGGEITGNKAVNGGGVYWDSSDNSPYFTGGKIHRNTATQIGGGVYADYSSQLFFGGDIQITENTNANVYLKDDEGNQTGINNSCGQYGSPNKPLRDGALVGILSSIENDMVSSGGSYFNERDFTYFFSDHSGYYIRSIYNPNVESHTYVFEFTAWGDEEARYPRVKSVSVKNSELIESVEFDYKTQTITLTAYNTKKNFFERVSLYNLIDCTYDKDIYYLYGIGDLRNLQERQEYKILSDNDTYVLCTVNVVPSGGEWAVEQEDGAIPYAMTVTHGETKREFINSDEGWAYAVSQTAPVTVTLFEHWVSKDGSFTGDGAEDGYLYMDDDNLDITIDLNGYTIDRGLKSAISDGQVFKIDDGKLTITDSIGTGKITGGNTTGYGGAFWVEYGTLRIKGGEISGNTAEYGGAIYCNDLDDAYIYVEGGKLVGNKATEDGGAIYMYDGYLEISGGEISGNTAKNGAGIYWVSDNAAFLTGGKIINNNASVSGGVFVETDGDVYVGGDVTITGNGNGNLYLYNGACISNARGQEDGIPNKPLSGSARIGISATDKEELISEDNSKFGEADFDVVFSDNSAYFIRSSYDADDKGHEYKLYINSWGHEDSRYPRVKNVNVKNSDIVEDAYLDYDEQLITLKVSEENKDALKSAALGNLISYTCDKDIYYIHDADSYRDLTTVQKYKTISDNGTYVMVIVEVKFICSEHKDADNNRICDKCGENIKGITISFSREEGLAPISYGKLYIYKDNTKSELIDTIILENESTENADITVGGILSDGEYYIEIAKNGYLTYKKDITVSNGVFSVEVVSLVSGDIKENFDDECGDGVIDIDDFVRVLRGFATGASSDVKKAVDINEDGSVNVSDLGYIKANFGKTSDDVSK